MWNLKKVDYFRKYTNEDKIQSCIGACISMLALFLIVLFSMYEIQRYLQPQLNREVTVMGNDNAVSNDRFPNNGLPLNIDLVLFNAPCESIYIRQHEVFGHRSVDPKFIDNFYLKRLDSSMHELPDDYISPKVVRENAKLPPHIQRLMTQVVDREGCHVFGQLGTNKVRYPKRDIVIVPRNAAAAGELGGRRDGNRGQTRRYHAQHHYHGPQS